MLFYFLAIIISMIIIATFNIVFGTNVFGYSPLCVIVMIVFSVVIEIAIQGMCAGIVHMLPEKYFSPEKRFFVVPKHECKFYEKIGIKHWKDKILELGFLGGFRKNKLANPDNSKYIYRFLIESNKGIIGHIVGIIFGFLNVFVLPLRYVLVISIPVAIVGFVLGGLPIFVLRYNLPKLNVAYKRAKRLEERAQADTENIHVSKMNSSESKGTIEPKENL